MNKIIEAIRNMTWKQRLGNAMVLVPSVLISALMIGGLIYLTFHDFTETIKFLGLMASMISYFALAGWLVSSDDKNKPVKCKCDGCPENGTEACPKPKEGTGDE